MNYKIGQKIQKNNIKGDCGCKAGDIFIITKIDSDNTVYFSKSGIHTKGILSVDWCSHFSNEIQKDFNLISDEGMYKNNAGGSGADARIMFVADEGLEHSPVNVLTESRKSFMSVIKNLFKTEKHLAFEKFSIINGDGGLTSTGREEYIDFLYETDKEKREAFEEKIVEAYRKENK